jgi:uncharacterized membrane protein YsdA (DUF1294 family)
MVSFALFYLFFINTATFIIFSFDKLKSRNQMYRTEEKLLFILCLFGGWIGGLTAMFMFNHKVRKFSFKLAIFVAILLNVYFVVKCNQ